MLTPALVAGVASTALLTIAGTSAHGPLNRAEGVGTAPTKVGAARGTGSGDEGSSGCNLIPIVSRSSM